MTFSEFGLHPSLLRAVEGLGYVQPTPIQKDSIPPAAEGRDVLACAATGSGKTAAFLLPILHRLIGRPRGSTRALILAPTRELAAQIEENLRDLGRHTRIRGAAVFGGVGKVPQEQAFRAGVDVIVATPGRLLDHIQAGTARLDGIEYFVLDEADRMLDMGFLPDIRRVLKHVPAKRQTMLFSATMPAPIVELSREMLRDPATLNIDRPASPAAGITHGVYAAGQTRKSRLLLHLLQTGNMKSVVVFTRTKHRANRLADFLAKQGISCARIHGNRSQSQRTLALSGFKKGEFQVLVATDIAARGIDVESLSHVVNFDVPNVPEDYIHRVGRTARAEATGDAFTFVSPEEEADLKAIEKALGKKIPRLVAEGFSEDAGPEVAPEVPRERPAPRGPRPGREPKPAMAAVPAPQSARREPSRNPGGDRGREPSRNPGGDRGREPSRNPAGDRGRRPAPKSPARPGPAPAAAPLQFRRAWGTNPAAPTPTGGGRGNSR